MVSSGRERRWRWGSKPRISWLYFCCCLVSQCLFLWSGLRVIWLQNEAWFPARDDSISSLLRIPLVTAIIVMRKMCCFRCPSVSAKWALLGQCLGPLLSVRCLSIWGQAHIRCQEPGHEGRWHYPDITSHSSSSSISQSWDTLSLGPKSTCPQWYDTPEHVKNQEHLHHSYHQWFTVAFYERFNHGAQMKMISLLQWVIHRPPLRRSQPFN